MHNPTHETDVQDLSPGVIHALKALDVRALSYVQLRRLYASLVAAMNEVGDEIATRSESSNALGETVRIQSPRRRKQES